MLARLPPRSPFYLKCNIVAKQVTVTWATTDKLGGAHQHHALQMLS